MEDMALREHPVRKEVLFAIGSFSMVIAIILGRIPGINPLIDFLAGLFTGLSLTLNLSFLIRWRLERNTSTNSSNQIQKNME